MKNTIIEIVNQLNDEELKIVYHFIKHFGKSKKV